MVKTVTDATFPAFIQGEKPVLVDFTAGWCVPCKMLTPIVEDIAEEYGDKLEVAQVDADTNPETTGALGIMSIPTLIVFQNGEVVKQLVGYRPKVDLVNQLSDILA